jgi:hypothetical protein
MAKLRKVHWYHLHHLGPGTLSSFSCKKVPHYDKILDLVNFQIGTIKQV